MILYININIKKIKIQKEMTEKNNQFGLSLFVYSKPTQQ